MPGDLGHLGSGDGGAAALARVAACDWDAVLGDLDERGWAITPSPLLAEGECAQLREAFGQDQLFRSTIDMARYRFGQGTYRYYGYPLPVVVAGVRETAYPPLAQLANAWAERLGQVAPYPAVLEEFLLRCHASGQAKPTPLILRYEPGGWNALHQDLYGEMAFPFQLTVALTEPGSDFTGGENLLVEQRPRAQSRGTALQIPLGQALVLPTSHRPIAGTRGHYRTTIRHGVSTVTAGVRLTLGIIFHDAA